MALSKSSSTNLTPKVENIAMMQTIKDNEAKIAIGFTVAAFALFAIFTAASLMVHP